MGYESCLAIASLALTYGMAQLLMGTFSAIWVVWCVGIGVSLLCVRDGVQTFREMTLTASHMPPAVRIADAAVIDTPVDEVEGDL